MHKDAGKLFHVFGEGYFIYDEEGNEVSTFAEEDEFNRLIEKFRHREFMRNELEEIYGVKLDFGSNNSLVINGAEIEGVSWGLPVDASEQQQQTEKLKLTIEAYCTEKTQVIDEIEVELRKLLTTELDAQKLVLAIDQKVSRMQNSHLIGNSKYDQETIDFLKYVDSVRNAAEEFEYCLDDIEVMSFREEADEIRTTLQEILVQLGGTKLALRVKREIREIDERYGGLRSKAKEEAPAKIASIMRELRELAPSCPIHGSMTLRHSAYGYFWGCDRFPECTRKSQASEQVLRLVANIREIDPSRYE